MCGIIGIVSKTNENIVNKTINSLLNLQHRGQDASGICYIKNNNLELIKDNGLIKNVLCNIKAQSATAIAHCRYTTSGDNNKHNAQPFLYKNTALCFNGNIANIELLKNNLKNKGWNFTSNADGEIILYVLFDELGENSSFWNTEDIKKVLMKYFQNDAYSLLLLFNNKIIGLKDIHSYRPLIFIETKNEYILSSEDSAIKNSDIIKKRELSQGEAIELTQKQYNILTSDIKKSKKCVFENIYFASPKSNVFDTNVKNTRISLGAILAKNDSIKADYVVPVMNSGYWGAVGYAKEKNIKLKTLIKNKHNILRTFIEKRATRQQKLDEKYTIKNIDLKNKTIVLVDDSIVRGSTSKKIIALLKETDVKEIHLRLTSPMIINTCTWGVDIRDKNELLAYKLKTQDNIKKELGIDSVKFIPNSDFEEIFNTNFWCHNCLKNTHINTQE